MTIKFLTPRNRVALTISITLVLITYLPWTDQNVYANPNGTLPFAPEFVAPENVEPRLSISQITENPIFYIEDLARFDLSPRSVATLQDGSSAAVVPKQTYFIDTGITNQLFYAPIFTPAGESIQQFSDPDSGLTFTDGQLSAVLELTAPDSPPTSQLSAYIENLIGQGVSAVGVVDASVISSGPWQISTDRYDLAISITINSPTVPTHGYLSVGQTLIADDDPTPDKFTFDIDSNLSSTVGSVFLAIEHPVLSTGNDPVLLRISDVTGDAIRSFDHQITERGTILSTFLLPGLQGSYVLGSEEAVIEPEGSPEVITREIPVSQNTATRVFLLVILLIEIGAVLVLYWQNRQITRS